MTHPEQTVGWEPASSRELSGLYYKTMNLAKKIGIFTGESDAGSRLHEGISMIDIPPRHEISLSADEVWEISPRAAETLRVGGPLEIMYFEQYYVPFGSRLRYEKPSCAYQIHHSSDSAYTHRYIEVVLSGTGEAESSGKSELRDSPKQSDSSLDEALLGLVARIRMERQTGIDKMTSAECQALLEIVETKTHD